MAERLTAVIEAELATAGVPGAAVGVVRDGTVLLARGFGLRNVATGKPVTTRTLFPIASCTKAFTAALVGGLVDEGTLSWEAPARTYRPGLRLTDTAAAEQLTLADMLSHRSGLPRHDLIWYHNDELDREALIAGLAHLQPSLQLRQGWQYNNLMFVLAGHIAGSASGSSWEDALHQRVLSPLGMTSTLTGLSQRRPADHSLGYALRNGETRPIPLESVDACGPAGSLVSNLDDMLAWLAFNLDPASVTGNGLPTPATVGKLQRPAMLKPEPPVRWPEWTSRGYGFGWSIDDYRGTTVISHGGNLDGFSSIVSMVPAAGIGIVVLSNLDVNGARDAIPLAVVDELLGRQPPPWGERFAELYDLMVHQPNAAANRRISVAGGAPRPRPTADYVGSYHHPAYGALEVTRSGRRLDCTLHGYQLALEPVHLDAFELRDEVKDLRFPGRFEADFDGRVHAVSLLLEPTVEPVVFTRQPLDLPDSTASRLAGRYRLGPLDAVVAEGEGDTGLTLAIGPNPATPLELHQGTTFAVTGDANSWVNFDVTGRARARSVTVWPVGVFERVGD
ncbi:serine hydrolase [Nakamurella lactea]|uniref:serine hydrolase n=1 Tax=Nakamurella lactea TaxID=459515 RepID=UPI0003FF27B0|nr:serine hydrolase [Nakamurella lactea]